VTTPIHAFNLTLRIRSNHYDEPSDRTTIVARAHEAESDTTIEGETLPGIQLEITPPPPQTEQDPQNPHAHPQTPATLQGAELVLRYRGRVELTPSNSRVYVAGRIQYPFT
jgi:hypothetical protein